MKKPEDQEPKDLTEDELSEQETDQVAGGALTKDDSMLSLRDPVVIAGTCDCKKGQGGTEDWKAIS